MRKPKVHNSEIKRIKSLFHLVCEVCKVDGILNMPLSIFAASHLGFGRNDYLAGNTANSMTDKERDELKEVIKKDYPGISEAEISFMVSFFEMMQAKASAYSSSDSGVTTTTNAKSNRRAGNAGKKKSKADRLVDSSKPSKTYTLYASIEQCPVKVFRRIKVPSNLWLGNLGKILITAFGWAGYHLSQFAKGYVYYTSRDNVDESDDFDLGYGGRSIDEMTVTVADVLPQKGSTISFEYDFGDSWTHNIRVSSVSDEPLSGEDICVTSGKGACPPEDVGGVWRYARMLDILSGKVEDPEEKASYDEWEGLQEGESYDPEDFDLAIANEDVEDLVSLIIKGKDGSQ